MSNNIDDKKNKRKKRKKNEKPQDLIINLSYEGSPEKEHINTKNNIQKKIKLEEDYINSSSDSSLKLNKLNTISSKDISTDDDSKSKENSKEIKDFSINKNTSNKNNYNNNNINKNKNNINISEFNINNYNNKTNHIIHNNNISINNMNNYYNNKNIKYNQNNNNINNITNINNINNITIINNNINKYYSSSFMEFQTYCNILTSNYYSYIQSKNKQIYSYNYSLYNAYLNYIDQNIKNNQKNIEDITSEINELKKQTLNDIIFSEQRKSIFYYIKKKLNKELGNNNIIFNSNSEEKKDEIEILKHPYFYVNHNEEIKVKNILYLIEALFFEENLVNDFTLIKILNRDGYASLEDLEKHPQLIYLKITKEHLFTVFSEHRINEVTETVETFDGILLRNKKWNSFKKKYNLNTDKIRQNLLIQMGKMKNTRLANLMEKKSQRTQIQDKMQFQYQFTIQRIKQFQSCFNYIDNIYTNTNLKINNNLFINNKNNFNYNYNNNSNRFYYH